MVCGPSTPRSSPPRSRGQLIAISESFSAKQARTLGTAKAVAIIDLAKVLPGKHTPAGLLGRGLVKIGKSARST